MKSTQLQKQPPKEKPDIEYSGFRYYIQHYGLAVDKLARTCGKTDETDLFDEFRQHIVQIIDPLAFESGYTQLVKDIERELNLIDEPGVWEGDKIRVKTIVQSTGSSGGVFRRKSPAEIFTVAGVGEDSGVLPEERVTVPIEGKISDSDTLELWRGRFSQRYAEPSKGDFFEIGISPTDEGRFQFHFNIGNIENKDAGVTED